MVPDTFTVIIDSLSYGGRGVGRRDDGKVVFVPEVVPGDVIRARTYKEHSSYILATIDKIIEVSPNRVEPRCQLFPVCGGCDWQHISYTEQLKWKQKIVSKEVSRVCHISTDDMKEPVPSEKIYGYRGHTLIQCTYDPELIMGFYQKRSRTIAAFHQCPVLNPKIQRTIDGIRAILKRNPVYGLYSLEIHAPQDDVLLLARCKSAASHNDIKVMNTIYKEMDITGLSFVMFGTRRSDHVLGQRFCRYEIHTHDTTVHLSSGFGGFIQANMQVNAALVGYVMELARDSGSILDLFSGSGNFSIPLSHVSAEVVAIEKSSRLVSQGKINAKKNRANNVRFLCMDATRAVESIRNEQLRFDTIVLDPPREGAKDIMRTLPHLGASRVIYISCNPSTLSRDLKYLIESGFSLRHTRVFDMFPQTFHIESVSYLERN